MHFFKKSLHHRQIQPYGLRVQLFSCANWFRCCCKNTRILSKLSMEADSLESRSAALITAVAAKHHILWPHSNVLNEFAHDARLSWVCTAMFLTAQADPSCVPLIGCQRLGGKNGSAHACVQQVQNVAAWNHVPPARDMALISCMVQTSACSC